MVSPDTHMQQREADKADALAAVATAIAVFGAQRRNPDLWERVHLVRAFASVFSGCYGIATAEASLALTPPAQRSPEARLPHDPFFEECDLPQLMQVLQAAQAEPARTGSPILVRSNLLGRATSDLLSPFQ